MKVGGRNVTPFAIGLGAVAAGYVVLRRFTPPPSATVTDPAPAPMAGYTGGAPPGPVADQDPVAGIQAALGGLLEQFGQPSAVEQAGPMSPQMRFEGEPAPQAPPPRRAPAAQPAPVAAPPKPAPKPAPAQVARMTPVQRVWAGFPPWTRGRTN